MFVKKATYIISSPDVAQCPKADRPEFAFIGRSNVGKSSLINMICDMQQLAKTSGSPGKTQLINHFEIESSDTVNSTKKYDKWYLVDLPGYGYAKVSISSRRRWEQMIENYLRKRENLMNVFVLIDARHEPQQIDLEFVNKLGGWEIPFCLVFTKADKETQKEVSKNVRSFLDGMRKTWQFLPPHFVSSAVKRQGKEKILGYIQSSMKVE
jgi:GTP-binding protein